MDIKPLSEIRAFLESYAAPLDIEIVDVEWNDRSATLTVYIETENGVNLNECEKFHNLIMEPIDELDPTFNKPYTLNISSPGLDRPFKCERDFERNLFKEVEIKLFAPLRGKKFLQGVLENYDQNSITINCNGKIEKLERNKIAKINKAIKFE